MKRRILLSLLVGLIVMGPSFSYNIWPQMVPFGWSGSRFITGDFNLQGRVVSPVYYEVREWLDARVQPGDVYRLFWLPIDPAVLTTLNFFFPNTPVFFPRFGERNYTQTLFAYLSNAPNLELGWNTGFGKLLANANVKYIIVDLSANGGAGLWKQEGHPALSPWGPGWDQTYYFTGDPYDYAKILDREQRLKLAAQETHFLAYENLDFVPFVTAYRGAFLVAPDSVLSQTTPVFSVYNYTNNLSANGDFENGLASWNLAGDWRTSAYAHIGSVSLEGMALEKGWIVASQDVALTGNRSYYLSGWMKIENARQSHVKLLFYDDAGNQLLAKQPQPGTDGTRDWWVFSDAGTSPLRTARVAIALLGGWSLDGMSNAKTWFDEVSFFEGYYPIPSPVRNWSHDILLASSMKNLISDIPGFDDRRNLIVSGEFLANTELEVERMKQFALVSDGLVFLGDASSQAETAWVFQLPQLLFVYEAESILQPVRGEWQHVQGASLGYNQAAEVSGGGQAVQSFSAQRSSYYTIAIRAVSKEGVLLNVDGKNVSIAPFVDSLGQSSDWYQSEGLFLGLGKHKLTVSTTGNSATFDKILMISSIGGTATLEDLARGQAANLDIAELSTTQYKVRMESRSPSFIVLGESFDQSWNAYVSGVRLSHYPLPFHMYWSNVFYLDKTGQNFVEISFEGQGTRNGLIALWAVGWSSSLAYVGYGYRLRLVRLISKMTKRRT